MKRIARALLIGLALTLAGPAAFAARCAPPANPGLVGFWESSGTSKGGIGHTLEFRADGGFVEATVVLVDMFYRVDGQRLLIGETAGSEAQILPTTFRIEGDRFIETAPDGSTSEKQRLGAAEPGRPPIVGVWRFRHPTGVTAFERYTDDGRLSLRLPMRGSTGCFTVEGGHVKLTPAGGRVLDLSLTLGGDQLEVTRGNETTDYRHVPAGPWYDREHIDFKPPRR